MTKRDIIDECFLNVDNNNFKEGHFFAIEMAMEEFHKKQLDIQLVSDSMGLKTKKSMGKIELTQGETIEEMQKLIDKGVVRVRMDDFMVHIDTRQHRLKFEVYPVQDWTHLPTGKEGTSYIDKENEPDIREEFEEGKCLKKLEGSFCWRGVWEGRLYFTDDEYWGEDIEELSRLYNDKILSWCKDFIKNREPDNVYDD